jgi:hypothetical protein
MVNERPPAQEGRRRRRRRRKCKNQDVYKLE